MGKVRKLRQKYSILKVKGVTDGSSGTIPDSEIDDVSSHMPLSASIGTGSLVDQLFTLDTLTKSTKITSSLLKQQFADFEERNTIATTLSAKSSIYAGMKKKTKKDLRHQLWLKKVEVVQKEKREEKDTKRRQSTAITGDMKPMADALADLTSFLEDVSTDRAARKQKKVETFKPILKQKDREREQAINMETMTAVMNDPYFKQNPFSAIQAHLKTKFSS